MDLFILQGAYVDAEARAKTRLEMLQLGKDAILQRSQLERTIAQNKETGEAEILDPKDYDALSPQEFNDIVSGHETSEIREVRIKHLKSLLEKNS